MTPRNRDPRVAPHRVEVGVVRRLVQRRSEQVQLRPVRHLEHPADRVLAGKDVVVRHPDVFIVSPAIPAHKGLPYARPLRAGDDVSNRTVHAGPRPPVLVRDQTEIPVPRFSAVDPARMQRGATRSHQHEVVSHTGSSPPLQMVTRARLPWRGPRDRATARGRCSPGRRPDGWRSR